MESTDNGKVKSRGVWGGGYIRSSVIEIFKFRGHIQVEAAREINPEFKRDV